MSAIGCTVGMLFTRSLHGHGFCFIPGSTGLPPIPCSVGWPWDKCPLENPQLSPQTASTCRYGSYQVSGQAGMLPITTGGPF